jgi:hypothetical protein
MVVPMGTPVPGAMLWAVTTTVYSTDGLPLTKI